MQTLRARNLSEEFDEEQGSQAGKTGAERERKMTVRSKKGEVT